MTDREPFSGRMTGIFNVEGDSPEPVAMFRSADAAARELDRRRALPEDDDDRLAEYHQTFPCDIVGVWWNDPTGTHAADALLAAPGNDVDQSDDGYPWAPEIDAGMGGYPMPCDCGSLDPALCTCRPGGPRPGLDDPGLDRVVTPHVYDEIDLDMIKRVF